MGINNAMGKEWENIGADIFSLDKCLSEIKQTITDIPAITDLEICKQLEKEYGNLAEYTFLLATAYLKMSQMYHYTRVINESALDEN
jgi:hypothetical protein